MMPKLKPFILGADTSALDHPLVWRGLVTRLNSVVVSGPYTTLHDAYVIQEFCDAFKIPLSDVSGRLETYVHASTGGIN